ncbi:coiled-coil domain-containing protein 103 isoform X1 [Lethenteron reissneri]|uniref:coiled-coil domain-containing protein 103 isoform X1 n=1 Tax=Lethenteron reissneri TaxID=7753 RepID=UPI002AB725AB|nr:coiled-coil domain-containing protein 103 isoform X1 [Lethenteron reissneri]
MDDEKLDWASLERELQAAVAADAKYQRENEAKLRAITQRVGSYEEFRDIVLASHLRPLETCDKVRLGGDVHAQRWNAFATTKEEGSDESQHETPQPSKELPCTALEFNRDWRRRSSPDRYALLLHVGARRCRDLFRAEVGFGLLGEAAVALAECFRDEDAPVVAELLGALAQTPRFKLNVRLLGGAELEAVRSLCRRLGSACECRATERSVPGEETAPGSGPRNNDGAGRREAESRGVEKELASVEGWQAVGGGARELTAKSMNHEDCLTFESVEALRKAFGIE